MTDVGPVSFSMTTSHLMELYGAALSDLLKSESASDVIVGIRPEKGAAPSADSTLQAEMAPQDKTRVLMSIQEQVNAEVVDLIGPLKPTRPETNLPGLSSVELDLDDIRNHTVESSWLTSSVRLTATPSMIRKLSSNERVAFVIPNRRTELPGPVRVHQSEIKAIRRRERESQITWGLDHLSIRKIWDAGLTGEGVLIGHLDTGVDGSHADLEGKIEEFAVFDPRGRQVGSEPYDSGEHGTHTAGILVGDSADGVAIGVAPGARLVSGLVLAAGSGTVWQIIKGMEWAVGRGIRVLNMSLGESGYSPVYEFTLRRVSEIGVFVVCSIGNQGVAVTGSPGNLPMACGVGAIDHTRVVASFSGGGSLSWHNELGQRIEIHKPDVVAPGVAVYSSLPNAKWGYLSGTSMAAPHVSGVAALLMQADPIATREVVENAIYQAAKHPASSFARDSRYGRGVVDPLAALQLMTG